MIYLLVIDQYYPRQKIDDVCRIHDIFKYAIASHHLSSFQVDMNLFCILFMVMNIQLLAKAQKPLLQLFFPVTSFSHLDVVYNLNTFSTSHDVMVFYSSTTL